MRPTADGWIFLFADVEGSTCAEDAIAAIAKETYSIRSIASRSCRQELRTEERPPHPHHPQVWWSGLAGGAKPCCLRG